MEVVRIAGRKHPTDLRTYAEGYLHGAHADHREFPGTTEIRYITDGYIWEGQRIYCGTSGRDSASTVSSTLSSPRIMTASLSMPSAAAS